VGKEKETNENENKNEKRGAKEKKSREYLSGLASLTT